MQLTDRPRTSPAQIHDAFVEAYHAGDLERLVSLYEPDAAMMPEPGRIARGRAEIREGLRDLLARNGRMSFEAKAIIQVDEIAYIANKWTLRAPGSDGSTHSESGVAAEVVRRGDDGVWRFVTGNPWGDLVAQLPPARAVEHASLTKSR